MATTVEEYLAELDGWQAEAAAQLRQLVHEACPDVSEAIKWNQPVFEYQGQLCYFKAFKNHINFGFMQGAQLEDPAGLLEGTGASMRHVKITSLDEVAGEREALADLVRAAASLNQG